MNGTEKNNKVFIMGEIVSEATFSHEVYGEGFYELKVKVMRLSGQADILPVTVSERLISERDLKVGSTLCAVGQFRSYNKLENGRSRLMLTVFVREPVDAPPAKNPNSIVLSGYICKPPVYRTTPFNREIADLLVAVNRAYNKSDYITISRASPGAGTRGSSKICRWGIRSPFRGASKAASIRRRFPNTRSKP